MKDIFYKSTAHFHLADKQSIRFMTILNIYPIKKKNVKVNAYLIEMYIWCRKISAVYVNLVDTSTCGLLASAGITKTIASTSVPAKNTYNIFV